MHAPAGNVTPPRAAAAGGLRQFLRTSAGGALLPAVICAVLWIAISYATGASTMFALGGGILLAVIVFIISFALRQFFGRRRP